ncbi:hypothetical protein BGX24_008519 [Mortierella sp. AD032]|nr:hypothetical protein BGX24_008519 [Mortierella sp. AD032]
MFTHEQQHHHLQILGHHPASPVGCSFLDLPADAFTRGPTASSNSHNSPSNSDSEGYTSPAAEDCQASTDYMYSHHSSNSNQYSNDQFAAMAPSYMMSMARSFSESQLSEICSSPNLSGSTTVKMELCDSPSLYPQHAIFEDDYHYHNSNGHNNHHHNLYSTQYHNPHNHHNNHHHSHSYSTSSLSTLSSSSDDSSSMSPRSTFSTGSLSLSSSSNSLAAVAGGPSYPLSRTLSEPSMMPIFQTMSTSSSMSDLSSLHDLNGVCSMDDAKSSSLLLMASSPMTASTNGSTAGAPKRSRGRRVSSHPDNSGCKIFKCRFDDCGKIFKRSEHLKRHVRSIHTLEKPFECPINNCPKRFSRSDNLNQHIRIHRHTSGARAAEKHSKAMASFTPFLDTYSTGLLTL